MERLSLKRKEYICENDGLIWETADSEAKKFLGQIPTNSVLASIVCAIEYAIEQKFGIDVTALIDVKNNGDTLCVTDIWVNCY